MWLARAQVEEKDRLLEDRRAQAARLTARLAEVTARADALDAQRTEAVARAAAADARADALERQLERSENERKMLLELSLAKPAEARGAASEEPEPRSLTGFEAVTRAMRHREGLIPAGRK